MRRPLRHAALPILAGLALLAAACHGGKPKTDPILNLSAEESLVQGKDLLAKKKYAKARPLFTHAFEVEPNSATGREALLLAADTYFLEGGGSNYTQAESKYRDYLNRFPTSQQSAYVQFQVANSLAKRMERPDRDQTVTRKALAGYQDLLRLYPTSDYAATAQEAMKTVLDNLAEHEFMVGRFYMRYGIAGSAVERFEYLMRNYPDYAHQDKILYYLGVAQGQMKQNEKARTTFDRLRKEHPQSPFIKEIPSVTDTGAPAKEERKGK
jgi:outer membrane protein assembly factor BamD